MVQVRRVARLFWATAERELTERPEALNYWLLVLHFLPPPVQEKTLGVHQSTAKTACWAVAVQIAIPVPEVTHPDPDLSGSGGLSPRLVCES